MSLAFSREIKENWKLIVVDDADMKGEVRSSEDFDLYAGPVLNAQVPGDWIRDYVREGLFEEPFFGGNFTKLMDYENSHVIYAVKFEWERQADGLTFLCFEGIDTVADIFLNGEKIGHAENMYIPHEFEARGLVVGENELLVHIHPSTMEARKHRIAPHREASKYAIERLSVRKPAHEYSWDICPRIVTSGLWRPVSIIVKKEERIDDVFLHAIRQMPDGSLRCGASFDVNIGRRHVKPYSIRIAGTCGDSRFETTEKLWYTHGRAGFVIENPKLWWPRGYGEPNLYDVTVSLLKDGEVVDEVKLRQGFRTTKLVYDDIIENDTEGEFCFIINGKRIYVKGTNWVPADAFHSNDVNRIPAILDLIKDIGCNALRVWGGGVYENDYFYSWCDENGIMVWQDFMMACASYPHTERMKTQLDEEARVTIRRLRRYASIILWAGDNECDIMDKTHDPDTNILTRGILAQALMDEDMTRPYLPSSPYVSGRAYKLGKVRETPERHLWGERLYYKAPFYHDHKATFASEMGYHGCNSPESIAKFIPADSLWPEADNPMWIYHAASPEIERSRYAHRIALMRKQIHCLFRQDPDNLDDYARMSQICQAEAKKFFVESFRSHKGVRTGLIWWNIMDCWPQFSDAVVDYYFCRKLAYFFIRRSQQPVCLMLDDKDGDLVLYGVNDRMEDCRVKYRVYDIDSGETVINAQVPLAADASTALYTVRDDGKQHFYVIEWETEDGVKGINHYLRGEPLFDYDWYMNCLRKVGFDEFEGF